MRSSDVGAVCGSGSSAEAADFHSIRPRLFRIAYQILGRVADAEDVVQDVWVRWHCADQAQVRDRVAFLVTITTGSRSTSSPRLTCAGRSPSTDGARSAFPLVLIRRWRPSGRRTSRPPSGSCSSGCHRQNAPSSCSERPSSTPSGTSPTRSRSTKPTHDSWGAELAHTSPSNGTDAFARRRPIGCTRPSSTRHGPATWPACSRCSSTTASPGQRRRSRSRPSEAGCHVQLTHRTTTGEHIRQRHHPDGVGQHPQRPM